MSIANNIIKPFPNRKYSFKDCYIIFHDNDNLTSTWVLEN